MAQTDKALGLKVQQHLIKLGIETPMVDGPVLSRGDKLAVIEGSTKRMLQALGLDLTDDSLMETPMRVAKMWVDDMMWGLDYSNFPKCTTVDNKMSAPDEFVSVTVSATSQCEHHLLSIISAGGLNKPSMVIAYVPNEKVLGLSKLSRIASFFAARPQVQERLTHQVMEAVKCIMDTEDVAVFASMAHLCMSTRGAKDVASDTTTCAMSGKFADNVSVRQEFLALARQKLSQ